MDLVDRPLPEVHYETDQTVLYEQRGRVAIVSMNRPRFGNSQNAQMTYQLDAAFQRAISDDSIGAILLRGEGKHFSAGHDIGTPGADHLLPVEKRVMPWWDHSNKPGAEAMYAREQEQYLGMCRRWRDMPKPMVAAVHGACIAGGLMLAWVSDIIIATDDAYFMDPVVAMGIPGVEYFAHAFELPPRIAREFLLLGERMTAEQARQHGMVNRITTRDQLFEDAVAVAEKLAERPRFALALTKQALNFVEDLQHKRTAMDGVFGMHHLAHAHNQLILGNDIAISDPKEIKRGSETRSD